MSHSEKRLRMGVLSSESIWLDGGIESKDSSPLSSRVGFGVGDRRLSVDESAVVSVSALQSVGDLRRFRLENGGRVFLFDGQVIRLPSYVAFGMVLEIGERRYPVVVDSVKEQLTHREAIAFEQVTLDMLCEGREV